MTPAEFIAKALVAAKLAQHVWPEYAVCEAALESAWGASRLAIICNDLFGQKQGFYTREYPIAQIPTREWIDGKEVPCMATWPVFPDWATAFRERMELLRSAKNHDGSLKYLSALAAISGDDFVIKVSRVWATDPQRAEKVLSIYRRHFATQPAAMPAMVDPGIQAET